MTIISHLYVHHRHFESNFKYTNVVFCLTSDIIIVQGLKRSTSKLTFQKPQVMSHAYGFNLSSNYFIFTTLPLK